MVLLWYYKKIMNFIIGLGSKIFLKTIVDCSQGVVIGKNSIVNARCRLVNRGTITIGDNVSISSDVIILTADYDMNSPSFLGRTKQVVIEDYMWVGTRAIILPGITIGKGAIVAVGSLLAKNVKPYQVLAGVPAKFIKERNHNLRYKFSYKRLFQ
jgi:maltose O-acetyltransferase